MKTKAFISLILLSGINIPAFAATGNAKDGMILSLLLIGLLLVIAGILSGIDFIKKNGRRLIIDAKSRLKKKMNSLRVLFKNHHSNRMRTA